MILNINSTRGKTNAVPHVRSTGNLSSYNIILLKYVCLSICLSVVVRSQTTILSSCSIVSGDISNCSYRLSVLSLTRSYFYRQNTQKPSAKK